MKNGTIVKTDVDMMFDGEIWARGTIGKIVDTGFSISLNETLYVVEKANGLFGFFTENDLTEIDITFDPMSWTLLANQLEPENVDEKLVDFLICSIGVLLSTALEAELSIQDILINYEAYIKGTINTGMEKRS